MPVQMDLQNGSSSACWQCNCFCITLAELPVCCKNDIQEFALPSPSPGVYFYCVTVQGEVIQKYDDGCSIDLHLCFLTCQSFVFCLFSMLPSLIWCTFNEGSNGSGNWLLLHRQLLIAGDCKERRDDCRSHSGHIGINAAFTEDSLQNVSPDVNSDQPKIKGTWQDEIHQGFAIYKRPRGSEPVEESHEQNHPSISNLPIFLAPILHYPLIILQLLDGVVGKHFQDSIRLHD